MGLNRVIKTVVFMFLFGIWGSTLVFAQNIEVEAKVDKANISLNDRLTYEVAVSGAGTVSIPNPTLPDFKGYFEVVGSSDSTSISLVNGEMSSRKIKKFVLLPIKEGSVTIPPAQITIEGKTFRTNSISVKIAPTQAAQGGTATPGGASNIARSSAQAAVFVQGSVSKTQAYVGEEVLYKLQFFRRVQLWSNVDHAQPDLSGFWVEDIPVSQDQLLKDVGGLRFYSFELQKKLLYPISTGKVTIPPVKVGFVVNPLSGQSVVQSNPIQIEILPLPTENKPNPFSGFVGHLSMSSTLDSSTVTQNAPLSLKITVTGSGNLKALKDIYFKPDSNFKIYLANTEDNYTMTNGISGSKTYDYILIPKIPGKLTLPQFTVSYFDPTEKTYVTEGTPAYTVSVKPDGKKQVVEGSEVTLLDSDVLYLKTKYNPAHVTNKGVGLWVALLLVILNIGFMVKHSVWALQRWVFSGSRAAYLKQKSFDIAFAKLTKLQEQSAPVSSTDISHILLEFLGYRLGYSVLGKTRDEIKEALIKEKMPKDHLESLLKILEQLDFLAFAKGEKGQAAELVVQVSNWLAVLKGDWA